MAPPPAPPPPDPSFPPLPQVRGANADPYSRELQLVPPFSPQPAWPPPPLTTDDAQGPCPLGKPPPFALNVPAIAAEEQVVFEEPDKKRELPKSSLKGPLVMIEAPAARDTDEEPLILREYELNNRDAPAFTVVSDICSIDEEIEHAAPKAKLPPFRLIKGAEILNEMPVLIRAPMEKRKELFKIIPL